MLEKYDEILHTQVSTICVFNGEHKFDYGPVLTDTELIAFGTEYRHQAQHIDFHQLIRALWGFRHAQ